MIAFDLETLEWDKIYAAGFTTDGNNVYMFADISAKDNHVFIKWLLDNLPSGVAYSHNGGKFDNLFVFDYAIKNKLNIYDLKIIHSALASFKIEYKNKLIEFRDSFLILPNSLKRLTEDFNVRHKKLSMDYDKGINDSNFYNYFRNDILGLYELLNEASNMNLTNKLTIASASMHEYLSNSDIKPQKLKESLYNTFKPFYYGGRTEVFKRYDTDLFYYDINSLYPYVMQKYKYPLINSEYEVVFRPNDIISDALYYCKIDINEYHYIPLLPTKINNKLIFPLGSFYSIINGSELKTAINNGYKITVLRGYIPDDSDYIFKDFIDKYYEIKRTSHGAKKAIAKLFLNSLYGKFGQRSVFKEYETHRLSELNNKEIITNEDCEYVLGDFYINSHDAPSKSKFRRIDIAMQITANARLELFKLMQRCAYDIIYCDTDSVITHKRLTTSDNIGEIKLVDEIKEFIALQPKLYGYTTYDNKKIVKSRGFRDISYDDLKLMLSNNKKIISRYSHLNYFKDYIKKGSLYNYKIIKNSKSIYDKRLLHSDGINTNPLRI